MASRRGMAMVLCITIASLGRNQPLQKSLKCLVKFKHGPHSVLNTTTNPPLLSNFNPPPTLWARKKRQYTCLKFTETYIYALKSYTCILSLGIMKIFCCSSIGIEWHFLTKLSPILLNVKHV